MANIVKLNNEELPQILEMFTINGATEIEQMKRLCGKFSLSPVRLARGKSTNLLLAENEISEHRGFKIKVADTIGADDSGILN